MKKTLLSFFLMLAMLLLSGCQTALPQSQSNIPLQEAAQQALKEPDVYVSYTTEDLYDLTGISPDDYTEAVFLKDSDTLSGRELIMVRAKDEKTFGMIKEVLEQYLSQRKEETRNYLPHAYRLLNDARVEGTGLTVSLIVQ